MKKSTTYYARLKKSPSTFRRITGITPEKFEWIMKQLTPVYPAWKKKKSKAKKRVFGGGSHHELSLEDRLLITLIYYRTYTTYAFLGFLFTIDESTVGRNKKPIEQCLAGIFRIPERKIELSEEEIAELFFDGTEQVIERPKKKQKKWYSGKKKRHTIKHQVVVVKEKPQDNKKQKLRIAAVSKSFVGRTHDKKIYDESRTYTSAEITGVGDTAYLGTTLSIPHKSSKNKKLTTEQKLENKQLSSKRIVVEHGIGKMKIFQVLSQRFRNRRKSHALIFKNVAGLTNLMFA